MIMSTGRPMLAVSAWKRVPTPIGPFAGPWLAAAAPNGDQLRIRWFARVMGTRRRGRQWTVVAVIAGLVVLTACGGGSNGADAAVGVTVTVTPTSVDGQGAAGQADSEVAPTATAVPVAAPNASPAVCSADPSPSERKTVPTTVVSLTFDDANADQLTAAAALQNSGLHGTFYAISGSIGAPNYLTVADLQTLCGAGNEIGGHTVNHPDLTAVSADEAQRQVCEARSQLTAWGFPQTSFAYPYGVVDASVEAIVKNCGYTSGRSLGGVQTQLGGPAGLYAETMPPPDPFALRAPAKVDSTWTLTDLENTVTNAETHGGGWDILTFHHVCEPGSTNCDPTVSITPELFTQFTTWLAAHLQSVPSTSVETVGQVIGGPVQPLVTAPMPPVVAGALTNASLETAATAAVPNCWSADRYGANTPVFSVSSPGHTGIVAETITMTGYTDGDAKLMPTFDTGGCSPTTTAGHTYQLGAWYKSTGVTQFEVYYRTSAGGFAYWTSSPNFAAATTWTQALWVTPALPAGATGISFGLNITSNGSLTTDDYTDADVPPATSGTS
jgi:peptidoglycan/xylan/chitin deacetylase (PgdA/CDA1 family)